MKIEAKINKINNNTMPTLKAYVTLTIENCFVITGIKLIEGKNGIFMSMPSKKTTNEEYKDVCFPITKEFRQQIIDEIMKKYDESDPKNEEVTYIDDNELPF